MDEQQSTVEGPQEEAPVSKRKLSGFMKTSGYNGQDQFAQTPKRLYKQLNAEFQFDFDPCPVSPEWDGLKVHWKKSNFVNPPYNAISDWMKKAVHEMKKRGAQTVFLIPFRPCRKYWAQWVQPYANEVRVFRSLVTFKGYKKPAQFRICIVILHPAMERRCYGHIELFNLKDKTSPNQVPNDFDHYVEFFSRYWKEFDYVVTDCGKQNLLEDWGQKSIVCVRTQLRKAIAKAEQEYKKNKWVILFLPVHCGTNFFLNSVLFGQAIKVYFVQGGFICPGYNHVSPFGTIILVYGNVAKSSAEQTKFLQAKEGPFVTIMNNVTSYS
jgi:hypothetical protein